ncbi:MAG: ABC transporter ATP-binding protein [Halobacteriota archaeon]|nr:ABC transporter ATP-binding protein [Halobacteriota archaeon]
MIQSVDLIKRYGDFTAVNDITFDIGEGEIFGIVGPNGAGKTTILKMCCGLIKPTEGSISISGYDMTKNELEIKSLIGFVPEDSPLYESMYVRDYLHFFSEIFDLDRKVADDRIERLLSSLNLSADYKKIGDCSKGMKRKIIIARSLINDPDVLIYDEPTSGLDPMTSMYVVKFIKDLKAQGKTILFSAHNLYQVESICDKVLIISNGNEVASGSIDELKRDFGRREYLLEFDLNGGNGGLDRDLERIGDHYLKRTSSVEEVNQITKLITENSGKIIDIKTDESPLEEIFVSIVNQ